MKQSNAQFTFDVKPGVGIYDDENTKSPTSTKASDFESSSGLDPVTYDTLVNYLDYELPRQQDIKLDEPVAASTTTTPKPVAITAASPVIAAPTTTTQQPKRIQPRPLAPALPVLAPSPSTSIAPAPTVAAPPTRQILMPKPPVMNANILASLLAVPSPVIAKRPSIAVADAPKVAPTTTTSAAKRPLEDDEQKTEDGQNPDEDKRRRNTAASARFRVKKKMREQAMEQSVREMTIKSDVLQDRVNNLESEIKFLRSLLLDKAAEQQQQQQR